MLPGLSEMKCPRCKADIEKTVKRCPYCNKLFEKHTTNLGKFNFLIGITAVIICAVFFIISCSGLRMYGLFTFILYFLLITFPIAAILSGLIGYKKDKYDRYSKICLALGIFSLFLLLSIIVFVNPLLQSSKTSPKYEYGISPAVHFSMDSKNKNILVTYVNGNILWSDIKIEGQYSTSPSPNTYVHVGDVITGCSGRIIILYRPSNLYLGKFYFDE